MGNRFITDVNMFNFTQANPDFYDRKCSGYSRNNEVDRIVCSHRTDESNKNCHQLWTSIDCMIHNSIHFCIVSFLRWLPFAKKNNKIIYNFISSAFLKFKKLPIVYMLKLPTYFFSFCLTATECCRTANKI